MSVTLLSLEESVLNVLNEAFSSTLGDLPSGTGGTTIATLTESGTGASTIKSLLNEGAAELARSCYPVPDTGTISSWTSGTRTNLISDFVTSDGGVMWSIRGVTFQGDSTAMRYCDRSALERSDPDWMVTSTAVPVYWYFDGPMSIGLYPRPLSTGSVTVDGFAVPPPMNDADLSSVAPWIPDDLTHLLVWYAAAKLAMKNLEDSSLAPRIEIWQGLYDKGRMDLWQKIDPRIRKAHFPVSPG